MKGVGLNLKNKIHGMLFGVHPNNTAFNYNWLLIRKIIHDIKELVSKSNYIKGVFVDVGCGETPYFTLFEKKVNKYIGLDLSEGVNSKPASEKFEYIQSSIYNMKLEDETADVCFSSQVFSSLSNPEKAINELSRITKKNGYIILTVPYIMPLILEPNDYYRFTPDIFKEYAKKNSLNLDDIKFQGNIFDSIGLILCMSLVLSKYNINRNDFRLIGYKVWLISPVVFLINIFMFMLGKTIARFFSGRCPTNFLVVYKKI